MAKKKDDEGSGGLTPPPPRAAQRVKPVEQEGKKDCKKNAKKHK